MFKLKKGHIYKIFHNDVYLGTFGMGRDYIICSPKYDVTVDASNYAQFECYFVVSLAGKIYLSDQNKICRTSFDRGSFLCKMTNADWKEVNMSCIKGGFKYNRKLEKLIFGNVKSKTCIQSNI
jgi:hypothetical protein